MNRTIFVVGAFVALGFAMRIVALDHISFSRGDKSFQVPGKIIVEAQDGGLLAMDRAGVLWAITPDEKKSHQTDAVPFELYKKDALGQQLLDELPDGFRL